MTLKQLQHYISEKERIEKYVVENYYKIVQQLVNKHKVELYTGILSDVWQVRVPTKKGYKLQHEWDTPEHLKHPIFADLAKIDKMMRDSGFKVPCNAEDFKPAK